MSEEDNAWDKQVNALILYRSKSYDPVDALLSRLENNRYARMYLRNNPDKRDLINSRKRDKYHLEREKESERSSRYRKNNRDKISLLKKKYYNNNKRKLNRVTCLRKKSRNDMVKAKLNKDIKSKLGRVMKEYGAVEVLYCFLEEFSKRTWLRIEDPRACDLELRLSPPDDVCEKCGCLAVLHKNYLGGFECRLFKQ